MALPSSFLAQVERHGCFSGCYGSELDARVCLDPTQPTEPALFISCRDCLTFKVGLLRALCPAGLTSDTLADEVTQHLRQTRGFTDSLGGYHMKGGGFWLNVVYYDCGLFLLDGSRSRALGSDLDLLMLAFQHSVARPKDPRMTDPQLYSTQVIYVDFAAPVMPVRSLADLLASPQVRTVPLTGYHRVTLAEFLPLTQHLGGHPATPAPAAPANPVAQAWQSAVTAQVPVPLPGLAAAAAAMRAGRMRVGDICPVCKGEYRERPLFTGSYTGCLC